MAQVVAGVSRQAEIAIHQGHKGQGLSLGTEAQQLWGQGDMVREPGRSHHSLPPPAYCPGVPPSTCCLEGGCAHNAPLAARGKCPGSHRSRSKVVPEDSLPGAFQSQGPWVSSQTGCLADSLCCYFSQIPKHQSSVGDGRQQGKDSLISLQTEGTEGHWAQASSFKLESCRGSATSSRSA